MGPNSFRNLTYLAVLAVVGALVYLIYQSSKKKRDRLNPSIEASAGLGGISDSLGSISGSSTASLPSTSGLGDSISNTVDGAIVGGAAAAGAATVAAKGAITSLASSSDVKDVTVNDASSPAAAGGGGGAKGASSKLKSPAVAAKAGAASGGGKAAIAPAKFSAGDGKGEFMVVTGAFSSKANAEAQVAKLKKLGFAGAEAVKLENSASTYAIAGYYGFKGGADAAVRTLKGNKIEAYSKKRSGTIYKPTAAPVKPAAKPAAPTTGKVGAPKPS